MTETPGERAPAKRASVPADSFANRLMLARAHAGHLSIRDAAELCGIGRGAWTNWEKGAMPVDLLYVIEVISEKLGVDPAWLLDGGQLAQPENRSRRARWSTVRPAHKAGDGAQTTVPSVRVPVRPRDNRPNGRPRQSAPTPTTRRPARVGAAA